MFDVILYTKENCSLCEEVEQLLSLFEDRYPFRLEKRNIYLNDTWLKDYQLEIPVVEVNGQQLHYEQIDFESLGTLLAYGEKGLSSS